MKKNYKILAYSLFILAMFLILSAGCNKNDENENNNPDPIPATVTDIDGNIYHTVTIGTQVWMVENLKTTKYNDGTTIPLITSDSVWMELETPGYCWYDNEPDTYKSTYGALYNWFAVNTGKLAPAGWHVPTEVDWTTLINYLGGEGVAGGKLKEADTLHWRPPNVGATNESGFTAVAAGYRNHSFMGSEDLFGGIRYNCFIWSSTEESSLKANYIWIEKNDSWVSFDYENKVRGKSVRCIMN